MGGHASLLLLMLLLTGQLLLRLLLLLVGLFLLLRGVLTQDLRDCGCCRRGRSYHEWVSLLLLGMYNRCRRRVAWICTWHGWRGP